MCSEDPIVVIKALGLRSIPFSFNFGKRVLKDFFPQIGKPGRKCNGIKSISLIQGILMFFPGLKGRLVMLDDSFKLVEGFV